MSPHASTGLDYLNNSVIYGLPASTLQQLTTALYYGAKIIRNSIPRDRVTTTLRKLCRPSIQARTHPKVFIIIVIKLSFIMRLNKTYLARKSVTEISKNNENKSKRGSLRVERHPVYTHRQTVRHNNSIINMHT